MLREALRTRRQRIKELLSATEFSFEGLREELGGTVRELDDDLHHVRKSLNKPEKLVVTPSRCGECDFEFRGRDRKRFYAPGRCPECRSTRIFDALLKIEGVDEAE